MLKFDCIVFQEMSYPTHVLDLMTLCWSHDPSDRPSANEIIQIARSSQFSHLQDAVCLEGTRIVTCAASVPLKSEDNLGVLLFCVSFIQNNHFIVSNETFVAIK